VIRSMRSLLKDKPHRRFNALNGEWVLVSPNRTERPWLGATEDAAAAVAPRYDPQCYLCPGNSRSEGKRNPNYTSIFVFDNDFPALLDAAPAVSASAVADPTQDNPLQQAEGVSGSCRVVCYSPRHDLTLAGMSVAEIGAVISTWTQQALELSPRWRWVQIFENKGAPMGCSNPHPHGQIWSSDFLPTNAVRELTQQTQWLQTHGSPLLLDYADLECSQGDRIIAQEEHWIALVPWWAVWPFEALLLPRRHVREFIELTVAECDSLAAILKQLLTAYDRLFEVSFPYSFGWHSAPLSRDPGDGARAEGWQLHAHFYPPLLRSASVRKFMVGYELLAEAQRDLTPEQAAERLRQCLPDG
jgi:UDPglucose--hexose-1-phosphate uridylyltransferase